MAQRPTPQQVLEDIRKGCERARGKMVTHYADDVLEALDAAAGKTQPPAEPEHPDKIET